MAESVHEGAPTTDLSRHFTRRALEVCRAMHVRPLDVLRSRSRVRSGMVLIGEILDHAQTCTDRRDALPPTPKLASLDVLDTVDVRAYQAAAAARAARRSGFVVAPCAAGKTLVGLMIAAHNGGRALILTTRYPDQWRRTVDRMFQPVGSALVSTIGDVDAHATLPHVVISTYSTFASKPRSERQRMVRLGAYETVVLDEAHAAAAPTNLAMLDALTYRYAVALTATKVREDNELEKLESRIGPTIVEIDRRELVKQGYVADVRCVNLIVPTAGMTLSPDGDGVPERILLAIDPNKMRLLCRVLGSLSDEGHRTLVFCDDLFCLRWTRSILDRKFPNIVGTISMETCEEDRRRVFDAFCDPARASTALFISRTGDEALDLPVASAAIVFCNNWGSRRQLVQRLGRLARTGGRDPVFVVLVAECEKELATSAHRERYAREHGFAFASQRHDETPFAIALVRDTSRYDAAVLDSWRSRRPRSR